MAVSEDLIDLVKLLDAEGYGVLAGELLVEVNLGREVAVANSDDSDAQLTAVDKPGGGEEGYFSTGDDAVQKEQDEVEELTRDGLPSDGYVMLDDEDAKPVRQRFFDMKGGRGHTEAQREPIPEGEQLRFAAEFLQMRLVEPVRAWAKAEQIAGELMVEQQRAPLRRPRTAAPTRIEFAMGPEQDAVRLRRAVDAGTTGAADELAKILNRLAGLEA